MLCAIWNSLYNLKNVKNTHGEALLLVKFQAKPETNFTFFNLFKGYQIAQRTTLVILLKRILSRKVRKIFATLTLQAKPLVERRLIH